MSFHIKSSKDSHDVIIAGSEAGMATKILAEAGLSVAVVEAGGDRNSAKQEDKIQLRPPWEPPIEAASNQTFW